MQHHSFFRNLPPLKFVGCLDATKVAEKLVLAKLWKVVNKVNKKKQIV